MREGNQGRFHEFPVRSDHHFLITHLCGTRQTKVHAVEVLIQDQVGNRVFQLGYLDSGHARARQAVNDDGDIPLDGR
jgi:hypothetical protein